MIFSYLKRKLKNKSHLKVEDFYNYFYFLINPISKRKKLDGPQIKHQCQEWHVRRDHSPYSLTDGKLQNKEPNKTVGAKMERRKAVAEIKLQPPKPRPYDNVGCDFEPPQQFPTLQVHPPFSSSLIISTSSCPPCFSPPVFFPSYLSLSS